jgi:hypothetical protein
MTWSGKFSMVSRESALGRAQTGIDWFDELVASRLHRLPSLGYSVSAPEIEDDNDAHRVRLTFRSKERRRRIVLRLELSGPSAVLGLFVYREPRLSMDDIFDVGVYAIKSGAATASDLLIADGPRIEAEMQRLMDIYSGLLFGRCYSIIAGEAWEMGFYHEWT